MAEQWVRVAATTDVAEGAAIAVKVGGREVALYHLPGGEFRATGSKFFRTTEVVHGGAVSVLGVGQQGCGDE